VREQSALVLLDRANRASRRDRVWAEPHGA
jgi:hypothetical protein